MSLVHNRIVRVLLLPFLIVLRELVALVEEVLRYWPGRSGFFLRYWYYKVRLKHLGDKAMISPGVRMYGYRSISIGANTHIDTDCIIVAGVIGHRPSDAVEMRQVENPAFKYAPGDVVIGQSCHIAPRVLINGHGGVQIGDYCGVTSTSMIFSLTNHYASFADKSRRVLFTARSDPRAYMIGPVVMEDNTGVGVQSVLLPGALLRKDSFVGIRSLVRGEIPANKIAAGSPAQVVRDRFENSEEAPPT